MRSHISDGESSARSAEDARAANATGATQPHTVPKELVADFACLPQPIAESNAHGCV
jgi:hypothetical protein